MVYDCCLSAGGSSAAPVPATTVQSAHWSAGGRPMRDSRSAMRVRHRWYSVSGMEARRVWTEVMVI